MIIYKICQDNLVEESYESFKCDNNNKYWLIMTPEEIQEKNEYFNFNYQAIYDCSHNEDTPKLEIYENYSFGILNIINPSEDSYGAIELNFFISKKFIIFVSKNYLDIFKEIKNDIFSKGNLSLSLDRILFNLIDKMTIKHYNMLSNLEAEISDVEEEVLEGKTKDYINDIVSLKNKLLFLKRHYEPLLDIVEDLTENENGVLEDKSISYFVILFNRIERLNRKVSNLRDYVTQIRESYQAQLDINLNNTMKLFTVLTAVFSPLSLIVGWYGMNFPNMPEFGWKYGYLFVVIISLTVLFFCLWIFKRKKLW